MGPPSSTVRLRRVRRRGPGPGPGCGPGCGPAAVPVTRTVVVAVAVAVAVLVVSARHVRETVTTYPGHCPVGLAPVNRCGVHGFRAGVSFRHWTRTQTRATHTPDTTGWAKPVLFPKGGDVMLN